MFTNYWTGNPTAKYKTMNGIDRATNVTFNNSYVLLENRNVQTNSLEGIRAIENIILPSGSGLKLSASGEISGDFGGGGELFLDSGISLTANGSLSGVTTLTVNPMLNANNVYEIKKGITHPYIIVGSVIGTASSEEVVSGSERYSVYKDLPGNNHTNYYIDSADTGDTIILKDTVEVESSSDTGRIFRDSITNTNNIRLLKKDCFSTQINIAYNISNSSNHTNFIRRLVLKESKTSRVYIPVGTEIVLIHKNTYYFYKVADSAKQVIPLSYFKTQDGTAFSNNLSNTANSAPTIEVNQFIGESVYKWNESYRFIVNFSNTATTMQEKIVYPAVDIFEGSALNTWINENQIDRASNSIQILPRGYSCTLTADQNRPYKQDDKININANIAISSVWGMNDNNRDYYARFSLLKNDGSDTSIEFPNGSKIILNNETVYDAINKNINIKIFDNVTNNRISEIKTLTIDMSGVLSQNLIATGDYKLKVDFFYCIDESCQNNIVKSAEFPFTIEDKEVYGLLAQTIRTS